MQEFISKLFMLLAIVFFIICSPFVIFRIIDNWDKPEYPYTGFCPDSPKHYERENTLPPTNN